jgi:hypothetical protein
MQQRGGGVSRGKEVHQGGGGRVSKGVTSWREGAIFDNKEKRRVKGSKEGGVTR